VVALVHQGKGAPQTLRLAAATLEVGVVKILEPEAVAEFVTDWAYAERTVVDGFAQSEISVDQDMIEAEVDILGTEGMILWPNFPAGKEHGNAVNCPVFIGIIVAEIE
jgi:hypothetical protein